MNNKGFTLLELLISIALVAVLLTGIVGLGARFVGNIHANQTKQSEIEAIYTSLHLIQQDVLTYYSSFTGSISEVSMLTVQKAFNPTAEQSGQIQIGYRLEEVGGISILYRKIQDKLMRTSGVETEILRAPEITFSFLGENLEEVPVWQSSAKGSAPVAWRILIKDKAGREWERTIPFMVRFNDE